MIKVKNITYKVDNTILLDDVSIDFEKNKLNLIIGPNGAGKSTLIKILCNQIKPQQGSVFYQSKNITSFSILELAKMRAVLSQNIEITFPLNVMEVVMMGRYPHFVGKPTRKDEIACKEAMIFFDVWDLANRNYATLSGGEKQRVNFARVIAQIWYPVEGHCRYLILDEPLTFLDIHYQFSFMHKLQELLEKQEIVVIGVVHDLNLASKFAHKIILLNEGKLLACGSKFEVFTKENIKLAYQLEPVIKLDKEDMFLYFN